MISWTELCKVNVPEGQSGKWGVERFTVEPDSPHRLYYAAHGRDVPPRTYTRLAPGPIMSDTPAEIRDHIRPLVEAKARGKRVLLNGLGLGVVLKGILSYPNVTRIDVVELEEDIIKLVAPTYQTDPRVHIYHADALTIKWNVDDHWTVAWHDIWPSICSDNLPEMSKLHRKYGRRADWQGSWCRAECQRSTRRGY